MSAAIGTARALMLWAVRGRRWREPRARGADLGEGRLRELDEVGGGWPALRWALSGARTARRDRLRQLPTLTPLGGLPRGLRMTVRGALAVLALIAGLSLV